MKRPCIDFIISKLSLFIFCLVSHIIYGQTINGKTVSVDGKPIAWASLVFGDNSGGTYSNEFGLFSLPLPLRDSIHIRALGYQDKKISAKSLKFDTENKITLVEKPLNISEVTVSTNKKQGKYHRIGFFNHPDNQQVKGRWGLRPGTAVFVYLRNNAPELNYLLNTVLVDLQPNIYDQSRSRIRIRVCNVTENQQPGDDLLLSNVLIDLHRRQNKVKVDISAHNIFFPKNGVFIGVEYIGWLKANGEINTSWTFATRRYIYLKGVINHSFNKIGASYKWTERTKNNKSSHWFSITDGEVKEWKGHSFAIGADLMIVND